MSLPARLLAAFSDSVADVLPVALVVVLFQAMVVRRRPPRLPALLTGAVYLLIGLTLFRIGLAESLLPEAGRLTGALLAESAGGGLRAHLPLLAFAITLGFAATLVEPALTAIAIRVREMTGGAIRPWPFRIAVALGLALALGLGTARIVLGLPLAPLLAVILATILVLALLAPPSIRGLALDSGSIATSIVTVPLIAALGVAAAVAVPGREALTDGFGLILLAMLMPVASVLAVTLVRTRRNRQDTRPKER